jgi:hypothetical protein
MNSSGDCYVYRVGASSWAFRNSYPPGWVGWVLATWQVENLSVEFVWMSPREDLIWFIQAGAFIDQSISYGKTKFNTCKLRINFK